VTLARAEGLTIPLRMLCEIWGEYTVRVTRERRQCWLVVWFDFGDNCIRREVGSGGDGLS
jgi:hypothetical protein